MRIVIDGRMIGWTGIGRYTKSLLEELEHLDHTNEYLVLIQKKDWARWEPATANFRKVEASIEPYRLGEQLLLPRVLRQLKPDLVHFLSFNAPMWYNGARITTVHDTTLLDFKNYRGGSWRRGLYEAKYQSMRVVFRHNLRVSRHLITDTEFGKAELVQRGYAPAERITAIHLGSPRLPAGATSNQLPQQDYLLYVGNLYPNKNLRELIAALPAIRRHHPNLELVIVGQTDTFAAPLAAYAGQLGLASQVHFTGFVTDEQLANYYRGAKLYVFPSLSEGFGLPPLEAMAFDLPVAAAQASCLPEVLSDAAAYFDPRNSENLAEVVSALLSHPDRLADLRRRGRARLKQFSWKRMAEQTLALYQDVGKS